MAFVKLWICLSALLTAAGWTLSAFGQLHEKGYACFFAFVGGLLLLVRKSIPRCELSPGRITFLSSWRRLRWRFRRPLPLIFLLLMLLALIGGAMHAPSNYDALTYRVPRVLHWLDAGQWHWVHTQNPRINTRVCGIEWLSAPLLLVTRTDRFIFLINWCSFLMLPGLVYSLFIRLGVRPRVAWHWMWLVPAGHNFALQAGSMGNDTFAVVYAMAAVGFALRAHTSGRVSEVWYSLLAAALLTGSKLSNLPLLLPWMLALLPSINLLWRRPVAGFAVLLLAAVVSCVPTSVLNLVHGANWSGASLEDARFVIGNPLLGIAGNSLVLVHQNFAPPFFPWAPAWNELVPRLLPEMFREALVRNFESGFLRLGELPNEEMAGLGMGVLGLLALSVLAVWIGNRRRVGGPVNSCTTGRGQTARRFQWRLHVAFVVALLAFMTQSGLFSPARIIAPYYPFLVASCLLAPAQTRVVRLRWWRRLAVVVGLLTVTVVIITPSRPLWPAQTILSTMQMRSPESRLWTRAETVYKVYAGRADGLALVRQLLPTEAAVVGFISSGDDPETSLWRPFGSRRVVHVLPGDDVLVLQKEGVIYYVIGSVGLTGNHRQDIEEWLGRHHGQLMGKVTVTVKVAQGPRDWYVIKLDPETRAFP